MISMLSSNLQSTSWALKTAGTIGIMKYAFGLYQGANGKRYVVSEFRKHPECVSFVKANKEKLIEINVQVATVWTQAATRERQFEQRCLVIETIAQILYDLPLFAFAVQTSSELGIWGTALVTVIPLATLLTKGVQFGIAVYREPNTLLQMNKVVDKLAWLGYLRIMILPAMIYSNIISNQGLRVGLIGMGKITLPVGLYFLWKQLVRKPRQINALSSRVETMSVVRKQRPSEKEYLDLKALAEKKASAYGEARIKREEANTKHLDLEKKYTVVHECVGDFGVSKEKLEHIILSPEAKKYSSKDPLDLEQSKGMLLKLKSAYDEALIEEKKTKDELDNAAKKLQEAHETEQKSQAVYIDLHQQFQTAELLYKEAFREYDFACKNYRHKVAELRQLLGFEHDELPWLMNYLKMYMEMESTLEQAVASKEEALEKLNVADKSLADQKSKLLVDEEDCLEKHLTKQTIEWVEDYVKEVNAKVTEFKNKWKIT